MVRRKEGSIFLLVSKELTAFPNRTSLDDINKNCFEQFRRHWNCLENKNQQLWQCRKAERVLNACVFENLVRFFTCLLCQSCHRTGNSGKLMVYTLLGVHRRIWKKLFRVHQKMKRRCICGNARYMLIAICAKAFGIFVRITQLIENGFCEMEILQTVVDT